MLLICIPISFAKITACKISIHLMRIDSALFSIRILHIRRRRTKPIFQLYEYPFHQRTIVFSFLFFHLLFILTLKFCIFIT